jgi:Tfp pilus assembly protein PilF
MIPAPRLSTSLQDQKVPVPLDSVLRLAGEFLDSGQLDQAEPLLDHILSAAPDAAPALNLKAVLLYLTNRSEAAIELMERAAGVAPDVALFRRNLCPMYERVGRYGDALRVGRQALDVDRNDLQTLHNLALVHYRRLELEDSIVCARRALAIDPGAPGPHLQLAETLLLKGDFAEGWEEYEWRFRIPGAALPLPCNDRPQWDGTPLAGKALLLIADQGFGDSIQFCRYIPWVRQWCQDVIVAADPILQPLIRQVAPGVMTVSRWEECPPFGAYCPLSGLPRLHGTTLATIPGGGERLSADPDRSAGWRARLDGLIPPGARRVGIVWAGRATHNNDANRSTTLREFGPIADLEGIALVSLQKGQAQAAIGAYFGRAPLLNAGAMIADFSDTMAAIETLDLVVTVDTAVAHLAGAMRKPVWILLPYAPDWRWLLDRDDSPWYPTVRLFRQSRAGDWRSVMRRVADSLVQLKDLRAPQLRPEA